jgi:hypothetical protein
MNDRALQDGIIRYLADATTRKDVASNIPIEFSEKPKAARFAHFLARRYYRDRLARSFRYSRAFRSNTSRIAEEIVDRPEFDSFLCECVLGSLHSSQCVAALAREHVSAGPSPGPWWPELLEYECCYFLQAATSAREEDSKLPSPCISTVCKTFGWALPYILKCVRAGAPINDGLCRETILLFSRTHAGRIYVVELEPDTEKIFRATDGRRTTKEIAEITGFVATQVNATLASLAAIGAVQLSV